MKTIYLYILSLLFLIVITVVNSRAQLSIGGTPLADNDVMKASIPVIEVRSNTIEKLLMEAESGPERLKHLHFAKNYKIQAWPENSGRWINIKRFNIWQLGIRSSGAYSIGLIFNKFRLEGNARLFVFNEDRTQVLGAYSSLNNSISGIFPVSHIAGDLVYIQLEVPANQEQYGEISIGEIAHAYIQVYTDGLPKDGRYEGSDTCNVDINCIEGAEWQDLKRAVCKIVINGNKKCTGTVINSGSASSEPYILTAAHCISSQNEADKSVFYFNYERVECKGSDIPASQSISGCTLISTGDTLGDNLDRDSLDFSLVKLNVTPPDSFHIYLAGWNRNTSPADHTVTIHHPHGDVKKISMDFDPPETGYHTANYYPEYVLYSHWRILEWDVATTEFGSSGAPLFDQDKRVIGLLTGGVADCNSPVNDYFTKFDYCWDYYNTSLKNISSWLDPLKSGVMTLDGKELVSHTTEIARHDFKIYPNPGSGKYFIQLENIPDKDGQMNIYSVSGEMLFSEELDGKDLLYFNMESYLPGLYIIRLIFPDQILAGRIIHLPY